MKIELWLIWKEPVSRRRFKIGILQKDEKKYIFKYVNPELDDARKNGFKFYPGFEDITKTYESESLFTNIASRLPNSKRKDYLEILNWYNLDINSSEIDILIATKGRLLTDNYEFVPAFNLNKIIFDVAGTRHSKDILKCRKMLKINDKLLLEPENNVKDENAIKVVYVDENNERYEIGYVPRYYSKKILEILKNNVNYSAMVQSLNFDSSFFDEDITANVKLIINN